MAEATDPRPDQQVPVNIGNTDLDPAAFLASVRELSERRDREDTERLRKLEEEVQRSRAERVKRRKEIEAERSALRRKDSSTSSPRRSTARSRTDTILSAGTTSPPPPAAALGAITTMDSGAARTPSPTKDVPEFKGFGSVRRSGTGPSPAHDGGERQSASSLARSGTLTWNQRRPATTRPNSVVSGYGGAHARNASVEREEPSREQIAASLGSRDPSWFRQTADRGTGSAAYRRSKDEVGMASPGDAGRRGLPGMSRETSLEPARQSSPAPSESVKSETAPSVAASSRYSSATSASGSGKPDLKALLAEDECQRQASPMSDHGSCTSGADQGGPSRTLTMSSSQARLANATERPASPTKGMGGFVQSAMMKRNDSVSKRWSATPGSSLSRQGSVLSQRSGFGGLQGSHSMPKLEPAGSRETSNEPQSRPSSSSSNLTALARGNEDNDGFVKPALPQHHHHSRSKSVASQYTVNTNEDATSPPSSPSKRFSPTKSSWIESALTRPDSPKPAPAAKNAQPSWMANLAKAKAERASADSTGTPRMSEDGASRPSSPTKNVAPFGQGMLRRSESRDLGLTPRSGTPLLGARTPLKITPNTSPTREAAPDTAKKDVPVVEEKEPIVGDEVKPAAAREPKDVSRPTEHLPEPTDSTPAKEEESVKSPPAVTKPKPDSINLRKEVDAPSQEPPPISQPTVANAKPEAPSKPQIDFRNSLRSRAPPETKQEEAPEFLSRFGQLRKTQTKNYVAPDVFGDNIKRGKADLTKTDGPVKAQRRDELKESLLAKKEDWRKAKEEGRELPGAVHERKVSATPVTPAKPEALTRREGLGRSESNRGPSGEKPKDATPEALARHKSLKDKPEPPMPKKVETLPSLPALPKTPSLSKQISAPGEMEHARPQETSKLAARFNPGLAGMLARGPPAVSNPPSRTATPAIPERLTSGDAAPLPSEPQAGAPLQDMRKGRAKGPKKRNGGAASEPAESEPAPPAEQTAPVEAPVPAAKSPPPTAMTSPPLGRDTPPRLTPNFSKPRPPPGSAASVMMASLQSKASPPVQDDEFEKLATPVKPEPSAKSETKPQTPAKPANLPSSTSATPNHETAPAVPAKYAQPARSIIPEFAGFGSWRRAAPSTSADDNKENGGSPAISVKSLTSLWTRPASPPKADKPTPIQLPSKRDEEAALRSAGLLASSPGRTTPTTGLGISVSKRSDSDALSPPPSGGLPPKPAKSSRIVSGQLQEASPNKGVESARQPETEAKHALFDVLGVVPTSDHALGIDVHALIGKGGVESEEDTKTLRRSTQEVAPDGALQALPPQEEYTFFDESVYLHSHTFTNSAGVKKTQITIWTGSSAFATATDCAQVAARRLAREGGSLPVQSMHQGHETSAFLKAVGGILITRRGPRQGASRQYMLCGRKHLGHIVFDEVDFGPKSLWSGFAYLLSYPVTLQQTKLYLWKGAGCSGEEIGAARLAAMDLSETGEVIEVDDGAEFASFLKIFGEGTVKKDLRSGQSDFWLEKAKQPDRFVVRLFRVQEEPAQKVGLFASVWGRRPSWNNYLPSSKTGEEQQAKKFEALELSPFVQEDLEAEGVYILDAWSRVFVLVGPLAKKQKDLTQALLMAEAHCGIAKEVEAGVEDVKGWVVFRGVPDEVKMLFRHWDDGRGLWGTEGLMAGSQGQVNRSEAKMLPLDEVMKALCTK